jgi:anti-anti-sigma factor
MIPGVETVPFRLLESPDPDGVVRLALVGELDLAVADQLLGRLEMLLGDTTHVRLDLSRLEFIDSRGLYALMRCVVMGREADGRLVVEVGRELTGAVQDVIDRSGIAPMLWPRTAEAR